MRVFVVERFLPALSTDALRAHVEREGARVAAAALGEVRHVRTTYLRDDELCFSIYEAPSLEVLRKANDDAALAYERILEVDEVTSNGVR